MTLTIQKEINSLIPLIVQVANAKEIILFGSQAQETADEDSDIDLCVISQDKALRKVEIIRNIYREIAKLQDTPVDVVLYENEEFDAKTRVVNSFESKIRREGVKVYGS